MWVNLGSLAVPCMGGTVAIAKDMSMGEMCTSCHCSTVAQVWNTYAHQL